MDSQFLWVDSQFEGFRSQMRGIGSQRFLRDCVPYLGCWGNCLIINVKKFFFKIDANKSSEPWSEFESM